MARATAAAEAAAADAEAAAADARRTQAFGEQLEGLVAQIQAERSRVAASHEAIDSAIGSGADVAALAAALRRERDEREEAVSAFESKVAEMVAQVSADLQQATARRATDSQIWTHEMGPLLSHSPSPLPRDVMSPPCFVFSIVMRLRMRK